MESWQDCAGLTSLTQEQRILQREQVVRILRHSLISQRQVRDGVYRGWGWPYRPVAHISPHEPQ